jgi:hypothetical protein
MPPLPPPVESRKRVLVIAVLVTALAAVAVLLTWKLLSAGAAVGERNRRQHRQVECWQSLGSLTWWITRHWDRNKALPARANFPLHIAQCPDANRFVYLGDRRVMVGGLRVLVVETARHAEDEHHAICADQKFLDARTTSAAYRKKDKTLGKASWGPWGAGDYFQPRSLTAAEYEKIRQQVEAADR